ncbi:isochorismatase family protein [Saccharopolyspora karakumensis]|uniref:Isochorismatase family protein n=1 Tax=Saccharopolyspora karakumensis TaxID=2530386 RepID=A0A4R5C032_9PSEU|nr:isochorismatase family protein [Saccharopolyspora karakumensis]TDD90094.1 isochorismatase family protein [Saccharopolyspora karakumensis]
MNSPRRALVVIDVQQVYFDGPLEIQHPPPAESLPRVARAIDAANAAGIPVIAVQHTMGEDAPVFNPTQPSFQLHPEIAGRRTDGWKQVVKDRSSIYSGTDVVDWLREQGVDTVTLVGYMTNNCVLASAVEAEGLGFATEVLDDATGAINLANDAGVVDAKTVHATLMTLLNSNWAAVASTEAWTQALEAQQPLPKSDLGSSAVEGARQVTAA